MAIEDEAQFETFAGNNSVVTAYVIPFAFRAAADLIVTHIDADGARTLLILGDDFLVTGQNLVTADAIPLDEFLEVERDTPLAQDLDTESPAGAFITAVEGRLDRIVMMLQDLAGRLTRYFSRTLRVPNGETLAELPAAAIRKGKFPYFNATTGELELLTPAQLFALVGGSFTIGIGTVEHLAEGETPTADITGDFPAFTLNLGLPTGATGGLDIGADASFGTTPNNQGGPALTLWDQGTQTFRPVVLQDGVVVPVTFP